MSQAIDQTRELWPLNVVPAVTAPKVVHLVEHLGNGVTAADTLCGLSVTWRSPILNAEAWRPTCAKCKRRLQLGDRIR